jgi:hypothetical protein
LGRPLPKTLIEAAVAQGLEPRHDSHVPSSSDKGLKIEEEVEEQDVWDSEQDSEGVHIMKVEFSWQTSERVSPVTPVLAPAFAFSDGRYWTLQSFEHVAERVEKEEEDGSEVDLQEYESNLEGVHIMKVEY